MHSSTVARLARLAPDWNAGHAYLLGRCDERLTPGDFRFLWNDRPYAVFGAQWKGPVYQRH
eukprot:1019297-Alexandrium_andersonii.AAC.1